MPAIVLIILLTASGGLLTDFLVFVPIDLLGVFHIPNWLGNGAYALLVSWCLGE